MKVISLGWGTQSFGLAAMSAVGVLPDVDVVIHADTTHERQATYKFAEKWAPWLKDQGMKVVTVKPERCTSPEIDEWGGVFIPAFTVGEGVNGMLRRQCTYDWKIRPIRKWLQANRNGEVIEMWLGITLDEAKRMKESNVQYIENRYPFLEKEWWGGKLLRRTDVVRWLKKTLGEEAVPARSACFFCPYHTDREWRNIRDSGDWEEALRFDENIRYQRPPHDLFVHSQRVPLSNVDLETEEDKGQLSFWEEECDGMCGL